MRVGQGIGNLAPSPVGPVFTRNTAYERLISLGPHVPAAAPALPVERFHAGLEIVVGRFQFGNFSDQVSMVPSTTACTRYSSSVQFVRQTPARNEPIDP
jgi:hypothetical protein